jgi:ribose 5-phosphate isomerase A
MIGYIINRMNNCSNVQKGGFSLKSVSSNKEMKQMVGIQAADLIKNGMKVGIGTGSTVTFLIEELGRRIKDGLSIQGIPTSYGTKLPCVKHGIPVIDSMQLDHLDLAIDGADEIDPYLNAIKGGGAAHTCEKIIASMADEFILIADESKLVDSLCTKFPLPVEVIPTSLSYVQQRVRQLGGTPVLRSGLRKDGPVVTENGNFVLDISFDQAPEDLDLLNNRLLNIPGLLETGLFLGIAEKALIAYQDGVKQIAPRR